MVVEKNGLTCAYNTHIFSSEMKGDKMNKRYDHEGGELYKTCHICQTEYHIEGQELFETDTGKTVCEFCSDKVVKYSVNQLRNDSRWYGFYELGSEEFSTAWMPTRKEAKDRLFEVIEKLHPETDRVED